MAYNKIVYKGETLIDLTDLDVAEEDVAQGKTFIKSNGVKSTGTSTGGGSTGKFAEYVDGNLTEVSAADLNGISKIRDYAFYKCSKLTSVEIPNSVTSIGKEAFCECSGLTSITIPDGVTSIRYSTFYECTGLTSITIPNSVTSIGDYAFTACTNLKDVYYDDDQSSWNSISIGKNNAELTNATIHFIGKTESYNNVETRTESNPTGTTLYITTNS